MSDSFRPASPRAGVSRRTVLRSTAAIPLFGASAGLIGLGRTARAQPAILQWGSSSIGSTGYVIIEALASTVNRHSDLRNSSMATSGGAENMALIGEGLIHFGQTTSSDWPPAIAGEAPFNRPVECHQMFAYTLWNMPPIVLAESDIHSFEDLAGRRVMPSQPTSSAAVMWKVVFEAAGLDVQWNYGSWRDSYDALKAGGADCVPALITNGRPSPILMELETSHQVRAIEIPEEILAKAAEINPGVLTTSISPSSWTTRDADVRAPGISGVVGAHPDISPEIGYEVTRAVFENEEEVRRMGVQMEDIALDFAVRYLMPAYPVNAGAAQYFQEKGVWRDELQIAG